MSTAPATRKQPLYEQLVDTLRDKIENELEQGDMLPSERELSVRYGLSRTTVRLALQELENLGLVRTRHGKGTFVTDKTSQATDIMQVYSFTEQMRKMGRDPETVILEFRELDADKYLAGHMGLEPGDKLIKLKRLRSADGMALMVERSYLPACLFPTLTPGELESRSLYEVIEADFGQKIHLAEEEVYASVVRMKDARLLDINEGAPVLDLVRTTYNTDEEIVEFTLSVARADQFKYTVTHRRA